jgi:hypothetical protein
VTRGDLTVYVERQLMKEAPRIAERALARLEAKREVAIAALPEHARAEMRRIPFFLMYGPQATGGGRDNGLRYHPKNAPKFHPQLDERWENCIVIFSAHNYATISEFWGLKPLVHEFAHAYHLARWPETYPKIFDTWQAAVKKGLYKNVVDEKGKVLDQAYAITNQLEYFAELSVMYFIGNNYAPRSRAELEAYDPGGAELIKKLWSPGPY